MGVTHEIALELEENQPEDRTAVLGKYHARLGVDLYLFDNNGTQLGGPPVVSPPQVRAKLTRGRPERGPPPDRRPPEDGPGPPPRPLRGGSPLPDSTFLAQGGSPNYYWIGSRIPIRSEEGVPAIRGTLFLVADSLWRHGFFFSFAPAIGFVLAALTISALCWLPLIRGLTHSVRNMQKATGQIASGHFEVNVNESRPDEIGTLGASINQMAGKLKGLMEGQKLFLAGVAHELCSPLARMELEVELLARSASPGQQPNSASL